MISEVLKKALTPLLLAATLSLSVYSGLKYVENNEQEQVINSLRDSLGVTELNYQLAKANSSTLALALDKCSQGAQALADREKELAEVAAAKVEEARQNAAKYQSLYEKARGLQRTEGNSCQQVKALSQELIQIERAARQ